MKHRIRNWDCSREQVSAALEALQAVSANISLDKEEAMAMDVDGQLKQSPSKKKQTQDFYCTEPLYYLF